MRPEAALLFGLGLLVLIGLTWADEEDDIDVGPEDLDEVEVDGPYPVVLSDGEGSEGTVQSPPRPRHLGLLDQEGAVVHPDPGHLVHKH